MNIDHEHKTRTTFWYTSHTYHTRAVHENENNNKKLIKKFHSNNNNYYYLQQKKQRRNIFYTGQRKETKKMYYWIAWTWDAICVIAFYNGDNSKKKTELIGVCIDWSGNVAAINVLTLTWLLTLITLFFAI